MDKLRAMPYRPVMRLLVDVSAGLFTTCMLMATCAVPVCAQGSLIHFQEMFAAEDDEAEKAIAKRVNAIVEKLEKTPPAVRGPLIPVLLEALPAPVKGKQFPWVVVSHSIDFGLPTVDPKRDMPVRLALIKALLGKNADKAAVVLQHASPAGSVAYTQEEIDTILQVPANASLGIRVCVLRLLPGLPAPYHERNIRYMMKVAAQDPDSSMRLYACSGLIELIRDNGRFDKELTPLFEGLVVKSAEDPQVRGSAMSACLILEPRTRSASLVPALAKALSSPEKDVQSSAIYSIGELGVRASSLVPQLCHYLKDSGDHQYVGRSEHILQALSKIGPAAAAAVPTLVWYLKEYPPEHFDGQGFVCGVLGSIGPAAAPACPELIKLLQNGRSSNRLAAAIVLGKIGPKASAALPALRKACTDNRDDGMNYTVPQSQQACKRAIADIQRKSK